MTALLLLLFAIENPSFEAGLKGWTVGNGAVRDPAGPTAKVEAQGGAARFSGTNAARRWPMLAQIVPCKPGQRVLLTVRAKSEDVRPFRDQYHNANAAVFFLGAKGGLGAAMTPLLTGTRDWIDVHCHAIAPPGTQRIRVVLFLSLTGTLWFDDVRLEVADNTEAFQAKALRLHLDRTYPFLDLRKPGPGDVLPMLRALNDPHVWLQTPKGVVPLGPAPPAANVDWRKDRARLTRVLFEADGHLVGWIGDIGFARIARLDTRDRDLIRHAASVLAARKAILDLRANAGGNEEVARRIAERLTDRRIAYAKSQVRDPTRPGMAFHAPYERVLQGRGPARGDRTLAVLQGPRTMSSGEGFVMMLRAMRGVTTIGLRTRGASGNPKPFALDARRVVYIPTWRALLPDKTPVEQRGIAPAIPEKGDALHRALLILRGKDG